jgi:hypothetical protein
VHTRILFKINSFICIDDKTSNLCFCCFLINNKEKKPSVYSLNYSLLKTFYSFNKSVKIMILISEIDMKNILKI